MDGTILLPVEDPIEGAMVMSTKSQFAVTIFCFFIVYLVAVFIGSVVNPMLWTLSGKLNYIVVSLLLTWTVIDEVHMNKLKSN